MRQFLILLGSLVCLVAAGPRGYDQRTGNLQKFGYSGQREEQQEQKEGYYNYGHEDIANLPNLNQRQKFILDVLLQVQKPLINAGIIELGQKLITDPGMYNQPDDEYLREFFDYFGKQEQQEKSNLYEDRQLIGLYHFLLLARDYSTFQYNVAFARLHCHPVMFVNALILAVRDRADTQDLVVPPMHEILPYMFFDKHVIESAQNVDYSALSTGTATLKPTIFEIFHFGGLLKPFYAIRYGKLNLRRPYQETYLGQRGIGSQQGQEPAVNQYQQNQYVAESNIVVPAYRENTVAYLCDDVGVNTFWNNIITERYLQVMTGRRSDLIEGKQSGRIYRPQRYGYAQVEQQEDNEKSYGSQAYTTNKNYPYQYMKNGQEYNNMQQQYEVEDLKDKNNYYSQQNQYYDYDQNANYAGHVKLEKSYNPRGSILDRGLYNQNTEYKYKNILGNKYNNYRYDSLPETSIDSDRLLHLGRRRLLQQQQEQQRDQREYGRYGNADEKLYRQQYQYQDSRNQYGQSAIENERVVDEQKYRDCRYNNKDSKCNYYGSYDKDYDYDYYNYNNKDKQYKGKYEQQYDNEQYFKNGEYYYGKYQPRQQQQGKNQYYKVNEEEYNQQYPYYGKYLPQYHNMGKNDEKYQQKYYGQYQPHQDQQQYNKANVIGEEKKNDYGNDKYGKFGRIIDGDRLMQNRKYDDSYYGKMNYDDDTVMQRVPRSIRTARKNYYQNKNVASISTYDNTPAQELMTIRSGELFIQNLEQLIARIYLEHIALKVDQLDQSDHSYVQLLTTGGSLYKQSSNNYLIIEQSIQNAVQQLKNIIDQELEKQQISQDNEQVLKVIADILMNRNGQYGGNIWDELFCKINADIYGLTYSNGENSVYNYHQVATYLSLPTANLREPIYKHIVYQLVRVIEQYREKLQPYSIQDIRYSDVRLTDIKVDKFLTYTEQFDSDLINLVDQGMGQAQRSNLEKVQRTVVARQERLNHQPFTISYELEGERPQRVVVRTLLGPKYDEKGERVNIQQNRQNYIVLDAFVHRLTAGRNLIERSSLDIAPYYGRTVSTLSKIYQRVMTGQALDDLVSERARYPHRLLLPRGTTDGLPLQMLVVITPISEDDYALQQLIDPKQVYGLGIPSLYLDSLPLSYPLDRPINCDEQELNQLPNILFKDVEIVHEYRQYSSGKGI